MCTCVFMASTAFFLSGLYLREARGVSGDDCGFKQMRCWAKIFSSVYMCECTCSFSQQNLLEQSLKHTGGDQHSRHVETAHLTLQILSFVRSSSCACMENTNISHPCAPESCHMPVRTLVHGKSVEMIDFSMATAGELVSALEEDGDYIRVKCARRKLARYDTSWFFRVLSRSFPKRCACV